MSLARTLSLVLVLSALNQVGALASAQTYRINEPFEKTGIVGDVQDFLVHPGGTDVLFRADTRHEGAFELQHVPLNGSAAPLPIVGLPAGRAVTQYAFSPDGRWVVYLADREQDDRFDLYAHRVGSPGSVKLDGALVAGGDVVAFLVTPDSTRVVYRAAASTGESSLFSVPIDASSVPVALGSPGTSVSLFQLDPSGARVVFDQRDSSFLHQLASARVDGSEPTTILAPAHAPGSFAVSPDGASVLYIGNFNNELAILLAPIDGSSEALRISTPGHQLATSGVFSPDGARIVWVEQDSPNLPRFVSRTVSGEAPVVLHSIAPGDSLTHQLFLMSPDSSRVVFVLFHNGISTQLVYSVPIDGSTPAIALDSSGISPVDDLSISPDGRYVVYKTASLGTGGGLRSMRIDGSAPPVRIDDVGGQAGAVTRSFFPRSGQSYLITPDSQRVVYVWGTSTTNWSQQGLYSVPIDRSAAPSMLRAGGASFTFGLDPAATHVVYTAADGESEVFELYVTGLTGGPSVKLSAQLARGTDGDVHLPNVGACVDFDFPAGELVYSATHGNDHAQLFRAPVDGRGAVTPLAATDVVSKFVLSPDRTRVVYARLDGALLSAPANGGGAPVTLDGPLIAGGVIRDFTISPDGARVVYVNTDSGSIPQLRSVPIGGGAPVTLAQGTLFQVTADSTQVVFGTFVSSGLAGLARVPIDGSAAPVVIDSGVSPGEFEVTPDGLGVVYVHSDLNSVLPRRLLSAPLDGSAPPLELAVTGSTFSSLFILTFASFPGSHTPGGHTLSPDGRWVVFHAGLVPGTREGLFARRIDASSAIVQLADAPSGQVPSPWATTVDSTHLLYRSAPLGGGLYELFSVPIDGSSPSTKLSGTYPPGISVSTFAASPDGNWAVFTADGVYSAPIDGSTPAVGLTEPNGHLLWNSERYRISPDSSSVVFFSAENTSGVLDLFAAPIDGSGATLLISPPLTNPGVDNLQGFAPDSSAIFYTATSTPGVIELFASGLPAIPEQRHTQRHD